MLVLFGISDGFIINCNLYKQTVLMKYTCKALKLTIEEPNSEITKVNGNFPRNFLAKDVRILEVESQLMIYLPQCNKVFPNLDTLLIEDCRQQFILETDFSAIPKLEYIHLRDGDIKEIHSATFDKTPLVWFILIENHQIKTLPKEIFLKLPKLREVSFSKNEIEVLDGSLFQHNANLRKVKFHDNKIQFIGLEFFDNFNKNADVWLQNNECIDLKTPFISIIIMKEFIRDNCRVMPIISLIDLTTISPTSDSLEKTSEDLGFIFTTTESDIDTESTSLVTSISTEHSKITKTDVLKLILIVFSIMIVLQSVALITCGIKYYKMV